MNQDTKQAPNGQGVKRLRLHRFGDFGAIGIIHHNGESQTSYLNGKAISKLIYELEALLSDLEDCDAGESQYRATVVCGDDE